MGSGLSGALIQGLLQGRVAVVDDPEWMPGSERRYPCNRDGAVEWYAKGGREVPGVSHKRTDRPDVSPRWIQS